MGLHGLTNVPTAASKLDIRGIVKGADVKVVCSVRGAAPDDYSVMTSTFVGEHLMHAPDVLRQMYASDLAHVIRMARDAGYAHAQADIRNALGLPHKNLW